MILNGLTKETGNHDLSNVFTVMFGSPLIPAELIPLLMKIE